MRPQIDLRAGRACAALAALGLTYATIGDATGAAHAAPATPAPAGGVSASFSSTSLRLGQDVTARGRLASGQAGTPVELQYRSGTGAWSTLATAASGPGGSFLLRASLTRSGELQVVPGGGAASSATVRSAPAVGAAAPDGPAVPVSVAGRLAISRRSLDVLAGHRAVVGGTLHPAVAGRRVVLQEREGRAWVTLAATRTDRLGRYRLRFTPHSAGSGAVRVRFPGDGINAATRQGAGRLNAYRMAGASWYSGGGTTACGGSVSGLGVANKTLPCGTMVTLRYNGRSVRVPVIDRGPYVAGRDYDLTPATKAALGFGDTGTVWATA